MVLILFFQAKKQVLSNMSNIKAARGSKWLRGQADLFAALVILSRIPWLIMTTICSSENDPTNFNEAPAALVPILWQIQSSPIHGVPQAQIAEGVA